MSDTPLQPVTGRGGFAPHPPQNRLSGMLAGSFRRWLTLATETAGVYEYYCIALTARTYYKPYPMWRRKPSCLLWEITPAGYAPCR